MVDLILPPNIACYFHRVEHITTDRLKCVFLEGVQEMEKNPDKLKYILAGVCPCFLLHPFLTSEAFTGSSGFTATVKAKITHMSKGLKGQSFS